MKAAVLAAPGIDNLRVIDIADPAAPGPGEVLVRLRAASLNYRDLLIVEGGYGAAQRTEGLVICSCGAGTVAAVGPGVERFAAGDHVIGHIFPRWAAGPPTETALGGALGGSLDGTASEYRLFAADGLAAAPPHLDPVAAATLPVAGLTAWSAVVAQGRAAPGDAVLAQGTGGVSVFALQFAKLAGATVVQTSSSDDKLARARTLGADHAINYTAEPAWGRAARAALGGRGVDNVIEVGGAGTLEQSLRAVRTGGTISLIGVLAGGAPELALGRVVTRNIRLQGVTCGSRADLDAMVAAIAAHALEPVVDRVFALADIRAALEHLRAGRHFGKVCIAL